MNARNYVFNVEADNFDDIHYQFRNRDIWKYIMLALVRSEFNLPNRQWLPPESVQRKLTDFLNDYQKKLPVMVARNLMGVKLRFVPIGFTTTESDREGKTAPSYKEGDFFRVEISEDKGGLTFFVLTESSKHARFKTTSTSVANTNWDKLFSWF